MPPLRGWSRPSLLSAQAPIETEPADVCVIDAVKRAAMRHMGK